MNKLKLVEICATLNIYFNKMSFTAEVHFWLGKQPPLPKREEARIVIQRSCLNSICFQVLVIVNFFPESERARIREGDHELKGIKTKSYVVEKAAQFWS